MEGLMADPTLGSISREEELHWLALTLTPGLGTRMAGKLLDRFRTPQAVFRASRTELEAAGAGGAGGPSIASGCAVEDALGQQRKMAERGAVAVVRGYPRYPALLREIFDPPILLFARGRLELLQPFHFAVVGTRRPTPYGLAAAERLSADLARAGLTIVSGMARGIDPSRESKNSIEVERIRATRSPRWTPRACNAAAAFCARCSTSWYGRSEEGRVRK